MVYCSVELWKAPAKWFIFYFATVITTHRFLNTLDTTHSNIHQQQTGLNTPQGFMLYLSTNFETRYLLSSCSNQSIDKKILFSPKFMLKVASSVFRNRCNYSNILQKQGSWNYSPVSQNFWRQIGKTFVTLRCIWEPITD